MIRTWTFGQKVGAGFFVVVVLTVVMGAFGVFALRSVVAEKDRVIQHSDQNLIDAEHLRASMQKEVANLRAFLLTNDQRRIMEVRDANEEFASVLAAIRERQPSAEGERLLDAISVAEAAHQEEIDQVIARHRARRSPTEGDLVYDDSLAPKFEALAVKVRAFVSESEQERQAGMKKASAIAAQTRWVLVGVGSGTVLFSIVLGLFLTRSLARQIGSSVQHMRSSSTELQASAAQQASAAKEQATAMSEITMTIGELLATSRQIAESGQHVAKMASDSAQSARSGEESVTKTHAAMTSIQQQVDAIVQHMLDLGKKSQRIGGILEIINELAEQTNILAINATIEAAGAGESGRRFAVVGEEIRKLADRVGSSTKEIRGLIEEIRSAVNATVMATETGSKTVEAGSQKFRDLQASFARIGNLVTSTMEAGKEIELSTKQQSTAVEQVNVAVSNVAQASKETETSSQQTLQTASQLKMVSDELSRLVRPQQA